MKVLLILEENSWKIEIKLFPLCAISHKNSLVSDTLWVIVGGDYITSVYFSSKNIRKRSVPKTEPNFVAILVGAKNATY